MTMFSIGDPTRSFLPSQPGREASSKRHASYHTMLPRGEPQEHPWISRASPRILHEVLTRQAQPLDVMLLSTWPSMSRAQSQVVATWHQGQPILTHLLTTPLGRVGSLRLPLAMMASFPEGEAPPLPPGMRELASGDREEPREVLQQICAGISLAQACGAEVVTLADALAACTHQGRAVQEAMVTRAGKRPRVTTAGATSSATLLFHLHHVLSILRRPLSQERIAVLAGDELALATVSLLLTTGSHPHTLLWCDVMGPQAQQLQPYKAVSTEQVQTLLATHGFQGTAHCDGVQDGDLPASFYDATLVVEATTRGTCSVMVDAARLAPGTILLLRDAGAWTSSEQIARRLAADDLLLLDSGDLVAPEPLREQRVLPPSTWEETPVIEQLMRRSSIQGISPESPRELAAVWWAGLLVQALGAPAICGSLPPEAAFAHSQAAREAALCVPPLHAGTHRWSSAFLLQFRARFRTHMDASLHRGKDK